MINAELEKLFYSGVSQRRAAQNLNVNRNTVIRKFLFIAQEAAKANEKDRKGRGLSGQQVTAFQFDEMESFEISKCLPLSILLAVEENSRKILGFRVASMPAKGLLANMSRKKYGPRPDHRPEAARSLFEEIKPMITENAVLTSDQNPKYPCWLKPHFPTIKHIAVKGRDGCVVGQGELKKIGFDPIFSLNHTAAMLRANINRLFRRTWNTTKRADRLAAHISIYVKHHNGLLTEKLAA